MNGMFDWLMVGTCGKVVWKYSCLVPGQLYMDTLPHMMLELSVNSLVTTLIVSALVECIHVDIIMQLLCTLSSTSYCCKETNANQHYHYKQVTIIISIELYCCTSFVEGTGLIKINYLGCNSLDYRLPDCGYNSYSAYSHSSDWGVVCSIG